MGPHFRTVLVTGPTGSGKSTTLAGMINYRNMKTSSHILTIEDPIEFVQVIQVDPGDGRLTSQPDGSVKISNATDVKVYLTGFSDYLPVYPSFKGRDYKALCEKTVSAAGELGYDALKEAHVADVAALMNRCRLELEFEPSGLTTDKLVADRGNLELENLYFNYTRYLQLSCSRGAPVPSNLQGLWNADLKPAWNCDYHTDINVQMNYWFVDAANLAECFQPLAEWFYSIRDVRRDETKAAFNTRGWITHAENGVFGGGYIDYEINGGATSGTFYFNNRRETGSGNAAADRRPPR